MVIATPVYGMGWIPDIPDIRDYTAGTKEVSATKKALGQGKSINEMLRAIHKTDPLEAGKGALPSLVDLRSHFSPIENQGTLNSCTANAGVALMEYFELRAFNKYIDASRLFLYKATRNLLGITGDIGAYERTTMEAMVLFGVPPEKYWPYIQDNYDMEPSAFLYSFGQNYKTISYYRLDPAGIMPQELLKSIKAFIAVGLPSLFGFTVYNSYTQAATSGRIPYPAPGDTVTGNHCVVAAGYDDNLVIQNNAPGNPATKGALLIRNSWGIDWGDNGYGWLPYEYVLNGLALDWWSLLKNEWVDTGNFA